MKRETCINFRTTIQEKERMEAIARQCGLSISEYLRKRALGYVPKALPTEEFRALDQHLCELLNRQINPETEAEALALFDVLHQLLDADRQTTQEIKEAMPWQPPACGQ